MIRRLALVLGSIALVATACDTGEDSVFDLAVGDCFNDQSTSQEVVREVPVIPCSEPHDNEIYFEYSMTESSFPGRDATLDSSALRCLEEFEGFVGIPYAESELDLFPITPTAESWAQGDRVVYCVVYALDLSKLEGTMRGSGR